MRVTNTGTCALTLPTGTEIPAKSTVEVPNKAWEICEGHPVVAGWIEDKHLVAEPSKGGKTTKAGTPPPDPGAEKKTENPLD